MCIRDSARAVFRAFLRLQLLECQGLTATDGVSIDRTPPFSLWDGAPARMQYAYTHSDDGRHTCPVVSPRCRLCHAHHHEPVPLVLSLLHCRHDTSSLLGSAIACASSGAQHYIASSSSSSSSRGQPQASGRGQDMGAPAGRQVPSCATRAIYHPALSTVCFRTGSPFPKGAE